jgi:hypothetical protein
MLQKVVYGTKNKKGPVKGLQLTKPPIYFTYSRAKS